MRIALAVLALLFFAFLLLQAAVIVITYAPQPAKSQQRTLKGF